MTRDEVIAMARASGCVLILATDAEDWLQYFAALVAAAEREACALVCDTAYYQHIGPECGQVRYGIAACAAAIRARITP